MFFLSPFSQIILAIVVLGVLLMIHELGHTVAAKVCGVRVDVFSLGFGPKIFQFRVGDTFYRLSAFPLGGYTKCAGDQEHEATGDPQEYLSKPRWIRIVIGVMGPAVNVLVAIALSAGLFIVGFQTPAYLDHPAVIGWVDMGSPADDGGLQVGDRIVRVADRQVVTWKDLMNAGASLAGSNVSITIVRNDEEHTLSVSLPHRDFWTGRKRRVGWHPRMIPTIETVSAGSPAELAGLRAFDVITAVDGVVTQYSPRVLELLQVRNAQVSFLRNGQAVTARLRPAPISAAPSTDQSEVGITFSQEVTTKRLHLTDALKESFRTNAEASLLILQVLRNIFAGEKERPSSVMSYFGDADERRDALVPKLSELLTLMSLISLNLGLINLLPLPILDGGIIMLIVIEGLLGRDLNRQVKERIVQVSFVVILLATVIVIYKDVMLLWK